MQSRPLYWLACLGTITWVRPVRVSYGNFASNESKLGFGDVFVYREMAQPRLQRKEPKVKDQKLEIED